MILFYLALSVILMLFNGGITGVVLLWAWLLYKKVEEEDRKERYRRAKEEFKKTHGYNYPGYM